MSEAVSIVDGKGVATTLTQYAGRDLDYDHLKVIGTVKARMSGLGGVIFKRQSGGQHAWFQLETSSQEAKQVADQLKKAGLDKATLSTDPETGNVVVNLLALDTNLKDTLLDRLKSFADEHNYDTIRAYKGTGEEISSDPVQQTATLREALQKSSGDLARGRRGAASVRLSNALWDLASEAGFQDIGSVDSEISGS
jgi:hypothetical protein